MRLSTNDRNDLRSSGGFYIPRWAVGVILALLLNAGAVVWGASSANTRLAEVERRMGTVEGQILTLLKR